jgi:hypothetical protein
VYRPCHWQQCADLRKRTRRPQWPWTRRVWACASHSEAAQAAAAARARPQAQWLTASGRLPLSHGATQGSPGPWEVAREQEAQSGPLWNASGPRKTPGAPTRGPRLAPLGAERCRTAQFSAPSCLSGASTTFFQRKSTELHTAKKCTERLRRGIKPELSLHSPTPTEKGSMRSLTTVAVVAMGFMLGHVGAAPMTNAQVPQSEAT